MDPAASGASRAHRRLPRWFLLIVAVLAITVAGLAVEVVQLNRALHQTQCNAAKATARAVFSGANSNKADPDVINRAVSAACAGKHVIFDL